MNAKIVIGLALLFIAVLISGISSPKVAFADIINYKIAIIASDSMEPTLKVGDIALLKKPETIKEGDIVAFQVPPEYQSKYNYPPRVIHRVVEIKEIKGITYLETKGDNCDREDIFRTPLRNVIGVYSGFKIPFIGLPILFLRSPIGIYIGVVVLAFIFLEYFKTRREEERTRKLNAIYNQLNQLHDCVCELTAVISDYARHTETHTAVLLNLNSSTHELNKATKELALNTKKGRRNMETSPKDHNTHNLRNKR